MITIETKAHVGADGTLAVQVPTTLREEDVEILVVLQRPPQKPIGTDENGWPVGFFEQTAGAWKGEPLERFPQGEAEEREALL